MSVIQKQNTLCLFSSSLSLAEAFAMRADISISFSGSRSLFIALKGNGIHKNTSNKTTIEGSSERTISNQMPNTVKRKCIKLNKETKTSSEYIF